MSSKRVQTHLKARIDARSPSPLKTASFLNAQDSISSVERYSIPVVSPFTDPECVSNCIARPYNFPSRIGWDGSFLYPPESALDFTPLRPVSKISHTALDRAVREVPWEGKSEILSKRLIRPEFFRESQGTPRREYQAGMINGIRVRAVFNPFFRPYGQKKKQFDRWSSRNWHAWNPFKVAVRGGTRTYKVPDDIFPRKDELGEWTDPTLSGRYQADIRRQYAMHGLPWIYAKDFLKHKLHILDKEPLGPKRWYKREYRQVKIREALRNMDSLVQDYRNERRDAKKKTWFEQIVQKLVGNQMASKYITERKLPKL